MHFFGVRGLVYDCLAMRHRTEYIRCCATEKYIMVLNEGLDAARGRKGIDFTQDVVRIGDVSVDSDELRFALEEVGL